MIHKFKVGDIVELEDEHNQSKHIAFKGIVIKLKAPRTIHHTPRVIVRVLCYKDPSIIGKEFNLIESLFRLSNDRDIEPESIPLPSIPN